MAQSSIAANLQALAVPLNTIKPDPRNARKHPTPNLAALKKSLEAYGQRKPIVVNKDNVIEAGNGLYLAAKALGWTEIAMVKVDDSPEMAKAFSLMDNQSALLSEYDFPSLKDALESLDTGAFDMDLTGFDSKAIEELMNQTFVPSENKTIDEDALAKTEKECPKCGFKW